jgi:hypothetical protein
MTSIETAPTYGNQEVFNWPAFRINETRYINNGYRISAEPQSTNVRKVVPSDTAHHEATHIVAAEKNGTSVVRATIIPGPGYLGLTELSRPDATAALAPDATGHKGTGYDVRVAEVITNGNIGPASNAARGIIYSNMEKVEAVASILEEKKIMGNYEIREAMDSVDKNRKEENKATVVVKNPEGREQRFTDVNVKNGVVMVPGEWINYRKLPKESIIFSRD